jgi:ribose 5-phosphate isomerase B
MKIAVACDHAAIAEKDQLVTHLRSRGHDVEDLGVQHGEAADYPDQAEAVAKRVAAKRAERGILLCGTGIGMAMAASKIHGVRAATIGDAFSAEMTRRHNDANVACFGARVLPSAAIIRFADIFLETHFDGGRHEGRVEKINALDGAGAGSPS